MKKDIELFKKYIDNQMGPLLINDNMYDIVSSLGETLDAACSLDDINYHYDGNNDIKPPQWYDRAKAKGLLIIRNIDSIPVKEQNKFVEIIKYKKINEFKLNKCFVILTYTNKELSSEILSLAIKV